MVRCASTEPRMHSVAPTARTTHLPKAPGPDALTPGLRLVTYGRDMIQATALRLDLEFPWGLTSLLIN